MKMLLKMVIFQSFETKEFRASLWLENEVSKWVFFLVKKLLSESSEKKIQD